MYYRNQLASLVLVKWSYGVCSSRASTLPMITPAVTDHRRTVLTMHHSIVLILETEFCSKKFEIATGEIGNPIKQDEKKGVLREFKKGDIFFNYGTSHGFRVALVPAKQQTMALYPISRAFSFRTCTKRLLPADMGGPHLHPSRCQWLPW